MMNPPPLPWAVRTAPERWILSVSAAGAVLVALLLAAGVVLPSGWICAWREITGLPCAGCGGTRSLGLLLSGDWPAAWRLNPGAVAGAFALALLTIYAAVILILRREPWRPRLPGWRWWVAGGLTANWLYLLLVSRP